MFPLVPSLCNWAFYNQMELKLICIPQQQTDESAGSLVDLDPSPLLLILSLAIATNARQDRKIEDMCKD